ALFLGDSVPRAGAFVDLQQAGILGKFALNSPAGQAQLAELDAARAGTPKRVKIEYGVNTLHNVQGEWRMRYAERGNDIPVQVAFSQVWMLVDKLEPSGIHIQTFFPVA